MINSDAENAARCMDILVKTVGHVDAERFIAYMNREGFDYTIWRRRFFDEMSNEEILEYNKKMMEENPIPVEVLERMEEYRKTNPYVKNTDTGNLHQVNELDNEDNP